jgi:hypothetical protein
MWCVLGERISDYCFVSQYCVVVVVCLVLLVVGCGWFFMLFVVVYYGVEDRVVNVCVYVVKIHIKGQVQGFRLTQYCLE